jgi:tetratricopeptide (TPR) repeat protein
MRVRQEQVVFLVAVALLGAMGYGLLTGAASPRRGGEHAGESAVRKSLPAPDPAVAVPNAATPALARELFAPPRDTSPLPPLELVEPPRQRLPPLLPPTVPGPAAGAYGLLRRALATAELPDLFAQKEEVQVEDEEFKDLSGKEEKKAALVPGGPKPSGDPLEDLTPDERAQMIVGWKQRYDWIQRGPGELLFGRIVNNERYGLEADPARAGEALQFVQLDPATGREKLANISAPPVVFERGSIIGFAFAATVVNEIELRNARLSGAFTRGNFEAALLLAQYCIEKRLEAPRALVIAEDLFKRAAQYDAKDPEPRLGLARCLEAAFRFEDAFGVYKELQEQFPHREEVQVALAELEERLLLHGAAEKRLREALAMNSSSWVSRFGLGRFLLAQSRAGNATDRLKEAVEHLKAANQNAPKEPELLPVRVAIRTALGDAHLALGELGEAEAAYASAVSADKNHQPAQAGLLAAQLLSGKTPTLTNSSEGAGFELLLARGTAALAAGQHEAARDLLRLAVDADPLRAHHALAALSVLAEVTGNTEEALRLIDEALERDPTQPFAQFQRGRLLGLQDDWEGARTALSAALARELDFEEALVALGEMAFRLGRFEDAERYLERAVTLAGKRPEVHALRGLNLLRLGLVPQARASFERALDLERAETTANGGLAWCFYLEGNPSEALTRLADIDEQRRNLPADDPWRVWSAQQMKRLQEHLQKVEWRDPFSRKRLANGWATEESDGVLSAIADGAVELTGQFTKDGRGRVYRTFEASDFLSFEADVWIDPTKANARIGIFAARERASQRTGTETIAEASVSRHKEGNVQLRFQRQGQSEDVRDMQQAFPTGKWVRLKLERRGESAEASVTLFLDGIPLIENQSLPAIAQSKAQLLVGLFAEGAPGREVLVRMDNVSIVTRMGL